MADINVSFYNVDLDKLVIERDFTNEANRMLPRVIEEYGKAAALSQWKEQEKSGASTSEKGKFIHHAIARYEMDASQRDRVRAIVIKQLKEQKQQYDKSQPLAAYRALIDV